MKVLSLYKEIGIMKICQALWPICAGLAILLLGCTGISPTNDIYESIPIGSPLSRQLIGSSDQVLICSRPYILLYNFSKDADRYDPHLLFFDEHDNLRAAYYFSGERVEKIYRQRIYYYSNPIRADRGSGFRRDLPFGFSLEALRENGNRSRRCNFLVDKMIPDSEACAVTCYGRKSENPFEGLRFANSDSDSILFGTFTIRDTCSFPLQDLLFDRVNGIISTNGGTSKYSSRIEEEMIVAADSIFERFFDLVWARCNNLK
jgi:hypothetical protein